MNETPESILTRQVHRLAENLENWTKAQEKRSAKLEQFTELVPDLRRLLQEWHGEGRGLGSHPERMRMAEKEIEDLTRDVEALGKKVDKLADRLAWAGWIFLGEAVLVVVAVILAAVTNLPK